MSFLPILMALRVRGRSTAAAAAQGAGLTLAGARACLADAATTGLAQGGDDGYTLTPAGRAELDTLLERERRDPRALAACYDQFLTTDARLKAAITAWQLAAGPAAALESNAAPAPTVAATPRAAAPSSAAAALDELRTVAGEALAVADRLAAVLPRLAPYARRLATAADALAGGDVRFVASPRVDSVHQVWFELHEDLLVTLGRERVT